jgi:hypothetical protein
MLNNVFLCKIIVILATFLYERGVEITLLLPERHAPGPFNEALQTETQQYRHCIRGGKKCHYTSTEQQLWRYHYILSEGTVMSNNLH